ncbi:tyrosine-type recombinase/integrase [Lentisalinibacter sediminis]|uniref:tyrosine-type recombinase/integrase n=1 Tax=Lentisalinibacter sediminis TaxID=2992237 RepID=UPI003869F8CD
MANLTATGVRNAGQGKHFDGKGLYLVAKGGSKLWVYRYQIQGKRRDMGLGGYPELSLKEARELRDKYRKLAKSGADPIAARREERERAIRESRQGITFKECAAAYIESHQSGWRNPKHVAQWKNTLETYAYPKIGQSLVKDIDTEAILAILQPIWTKKTETASRVRGRIENILDWARVRGFRVGENPARWRGHLDKLLPKRSKVAPVTHHPALPYFELPAFMAELRQKDPISARALEFLILTAARTGEVIRATWEEFDLEAGIWTIPGERMKGSRPHRVALSKQAKAIVEKLKERRESEFVFPGARPNRPISSMTMLKLLRTLGHDGITVHGFRSTFRDWCAEQTSFPREIAEAALAHVLSDKTEAAYQRGDMFERRKKLMQSWANFGYTKAKNADRVVQLLGKGAA